MQIQPDDVTDEMLQAVAAFSQDGSLCWYTASNRDLFAACVNAWLSAQPGIGKRALDGEVKVEVRWFGSDENSD